MKRGNKESLSLVYFSIGRYYYKINNDYQEALKYFIKSEIIFRKLRKLSEIKKLEYVNLLHEIGCVLHYLHRIPESHKYHALGLEASLESIDRRDKDFTTLIIHTATCLSNHNKNQKALKYLKEVLKVADNQADRILCLSGISEIYKKLGKTKQAREYHLKAQTVNDEKYFNLVRYIETEYNC